MIPTVCLLFIVYIAPVFLFVPYQNGDHIFWACEELSQLRQTFCLFTSYRSDLDLFALLITFWPCLKPTCYLSIEHLIIEILPQHIALYIYIESGPYHWALSAF